jgi:hypothetical protein
MKEELYAAAFESPMRSEMASQVQQSIFTTHTLQPAQPVQPAPKRPEEEWFEEDEGLYAAAFEPSMSGKVTSQIQTVSTAHAILKSQPAPKRFKEDEELHAAAFESPTSGKATSQIQPASTIYAKLQSQPAPKDNWKNFLRQPLMLGVAHQHCRM